MKLLPRPTYEMIVECFIIAHALDTTLLAHGTVSSSFITFFYTEMDHKKKKRHRNEALYNIYNMTHFYPGHDQTTMICFE